MKSVGSWNSVLSAWSMMSGLSFGSVLSLGSALSVGSTGSLEVSCGLVAHAKGSARLVRCPALVTPRSPKSWVSVCHPS